MEADAAGGWDNGLRVVELIAGPTYGWPTCADSDTSQYGLMLSLGLSGPSPLTLIMIAVSLLLPTH